MQSPRALFPRKRRSQTFGEATRHEIRSFYASSRELVGIHDRERFVFCATQKARQKADILRRDFLRLRLESFVGGKGTAPSLRRAPPPPRANSWESRSRAARLLRQHEKSAPFGALSCWRDFLRLRLESFVGGKGTAPSLRRAPPPPRANSWEFTVSSGSSSAPTRKKRPLRGALVLAPIG